MQHVILAAGVGERLRPLTETMSKAMIPVANRPIIDWALDATGKGAIVVARREQKDLIEHVKGRARIVYQDKARGTGHALLQARPHVSGAFIAMNVDEFVAKEELAQLAKLKGMHIACAESERPQSYGVLNVSDGKVTSIDEKPAKPRGNKVNAGIYLLDERVFAVLEKLKPSPRGEIELTDAMNALAKQYELKPFVLKRWQTITYPWDLLDVNAFILEKGSLISGEADIRQGAVIEHPVAIGPGAIVGPNCYIRKNSSIGAHCKVGNAVEVKNSIIMDGTYVSHLSYVGDSIIGRNCNIAAGSIFANLRLDEGTVHVVIGTKRVDSGHKKLGGIVGDKVRFGINVTVMPGKKIWPGILVPPAMNVSEDLTKQPSLKKR